MGGTEYKVSVITPVHNASATMAATFDSVRAQTIGFENIEYIVVDDCSSDGSYETALGWAREYENVRALRTPKNSGAAGEPRNLAVASAGAPYIMFIDDDDLLQPSACERLYNEIERTGCDIATGTCFAALPDGSRSSEADADVMRCPDAREGVYDFDSFGERECRLFCYNFCAKIYRRALIAQKEIRFANERMWEDSAFSYTYLTQCGSGAFINTDVLSRTVAPDSLSHDHSVCYYTAIPRSIEFALAQCVRLGGEARFMRYLDLAGTVEHYLGMLLGEDGFSDAQLSEALAAWKNVLAMACDQSFYLHSPHAKIVSRAMAEGDEAGAVYDFLELRRLRLQRETEKENIFSSTTWRLASRAQKLLGRR